ncbi:hypothetical protein HG531_003149 [Fusarium graminearum]|nr:hypothetical protein HG531_003149 [Fusarium graminearum]
MALTKRSYCQRLKSLLYAKSPAAIAFSYDGRALTEIWRIMVSTSICEEGLHRTLLNFRIGFVVIPAGSLTSGRGCGWFLIICLRLVPPIDFVQVVLSSVNLTSRFGFSRNFAKVDAEKRCFLFFLQSGGRARAIGLGAGGLRFTESVFFSLFNLFGLFNLFSGFESHVIVHLGI